MILKRPVNSHRLRSLPPSGFGWIDHRLLRDGYFQRCRPEALALYSLLVCAGDAQGLSFYSEARIAELLGLDSHALLRARNELIAAELIAFCKPIYQVLALSAPPRPGHASNRWRAESGGVSPAARPSAPPPPQKPDIAVGCGEQPAAPAGLDLCAMVKASLKKGGAL
jgi:hypothetical protein